MKKTLLLLAFSCFSLATLKAQSYKVLDLESKSNMPTTLKYKGKLVKGLKWEDGNGINYLLLTESKIKVKIAIEQYGNDLSSKEIYAYHYMQSDEGFSLNRRILDYSRKCEFDVIAEHMPKALTLSDVDADGKAEVCLMYQVDCTSDVSPNRMKLMMLENGEKYPLRGYSQVYGMGGDFKIGKEFNKAPSSFLKQAKKVWNKYKGK